MTILQDRARRAHTIAVGPNDEGADGHGISERLSESDENKILYGWNETRVEYPDVRVHELFEQQVARTPDAIAIVFGDRTLTYRELNERANQVAHFLIERGVGPDQLVGVSLYRCPELVLALLGVWKAGGAYVPLDPAYPVERLAFMVSDADISILLTETKCKHLFPSAAQATVCLDSEWKRTFAERSTVNPTTAGSPSDLAYVMYTSGSTGKPKGAMIVHRGLVNYLLWAVEAYRVEPGGSVPVHTSVSFDLTVTSLYPVLLVGGSAELVAEDMGAQNLLAALRRGKHRSLVKITPAHLDLLSQQIRPQQMTGLTKVFVIGGENLTAESLALWRAFAPDTRLINEYGPTETVVGCCVYEVNADTPENGSVPIGRPIANTELYVLGPDMRPVPPGTTGELYIGGAGVARGYLNRPELTRERFVPDPFTARHEAHLYKTGDLARYQPDGTLEYLGRVDDQVKIRGYRIELGEIESVLAGHPAVQSCVVLAREDTPGNRELVGYVVARNEETPSTDDLRAFLEHRLPDYMVPAKFVLLRAFPLTQNGKVDRKALPAPSDADVSPIRTFVAPRNDTERAIAELWCELLGVKDVGITDDFFDLGAHSLLVLKVLARVRDVFGVEVPAQTFFESPTIGALAAIVDNQQCEDDKAHRGQEPAHDARRIVPHHRSDPTVLSFSQEQIWLLQQLVPDSPAYNIVDFIPLRGEYRARALEQAMRELIHRHETLRTVFTQTDGRVMQVVLPEAELVLSELDLSSLSERERELEWVCIVRENGRKHFDLSRAPLFRVAVVHDSPEQHRVLLTIHHVIADEWSMELIHEEIGRLYDAFSRGHLPPVPELPIQYTDYAVWQREWLQGAVLKQQADYWKRELEGAPHAITLPIDKPRPRMPTFRGATEFFEVPRQVIDRVHALGRQEQATPFMVLEAAFGALMHRYTGQDDILVGTPISGRTQSETQQLIGCFLNTIVLRAQFSDDQTFRTLLQQTRARALGAYAHPDLPFERLVAELSPDRDAGSTPLFQVMFILHSPGGVSQVSNLSNYRELETGTSKFDLTLYLSETDQGLEGLMEYSTDLFEAETIRRLCRHYRNLLDAVTADPDRAIQKAPLLEPPERQELLVERNDTGTTFLRSDLPLSQLVEQQAKRSPDRIAVSFENRSLTYAELDRRGNQLANRLVEIGVAPGVVVGLCIERSLDMVVALLGILKAGGAYVPLDPSFPPDRLAHMVSDSKMGVLVTHRDLDRNLRTCPSSVVRLDHDANELSKRSADAPSTRPGRNDPAYVLYTSGSTGVPKGVTVPHFAIVNFLLSMQREPGLSSEDKLLAVTTLSFDIAALDLFLPLITGAELVITTRADVLDAARLMQCLSDSGATAMQATPTTWRMLLAAGWRGSPTLKALCGGEALTPDLAESLLPRCAELWNMYGPTETTVWSTVHRVTKVEGQIPIGHPIANTQVYVLDAHRELVPSGVVGELYIGGAGLARGYLHRPELTRERFVPSPFAEDGRLYRTGDLGRWRLDGALECLGRTDHQVKLRGYRIEPGEIESNIARHPRARQVVVVAREDVSGDKRLVAYVVADEPDTGLVDELRAGLRTLPDYMMPSHFVCLDALPLTPNGKVDRKSLPPPDASSLSSKTSYVAPGNDLEISLATVWQRVLGMERVGLDDSFFELGGSSLSVVRLIMEMKNATGLEVSLGTVFRFPTIAGLLRNLGADVVKSASVVVPLQPEGDGLPVFCLCGINIYREFAASLGKSQPVFGVYVAEEEELTKQALDGRKLDTSIERLADAYYEAILRVAPQGPYRLAGISFGGVLAMEVASRMRRAGADVEWAVLLDTILPRGLHRSWLKWSYRQAAEIVHDRNWTEHLRGKLAKLEAKVLQRWRKSAQRREPLSVSEAFAIKQLAFYEAIGSWHSDELVSDFRVVLFRASNHSGWGSDVQFDEDYGWRHHVTGDLSVVPVEGDHLGIIQPPHVGDLGAKARDILGL